MQTTKDFVYTVNDTKTKGKNSEGKGIVTGPRHSKNIVDAVKNSDPKVVSATVLAPISLGALGAVVKYYLSKKDDNTAPIPDPVDPDQKSNNGSSNPDTLQNGSGKKKISKLWWLILLVVPIILGLYKKKRVVNWASNFAAAMYIRVFGLEEFCRNYDILYYDKNECKNMFRKILSKSDFELWNVEYDKNYVNKLQPWSKEIVHKLLELHNTVGNSYNKDKQHFDLIYKITDKLIIAKEKTKEILGILDICGKDKIDESKLSCDEKCDIVCSIFDEKFKLIDILDTVDLLKYDARLVDIFGAEKTQSIIDQSLVLKCMLDPESFKKLLIYAEKDPIPIVDKYVPDFSKKFDEISDKDLKKALADYILVLNKNLMIYKKKIEDAKKCANQIKISKENRDTFLYNYVFKNQ